MITERSTHLFGDGSDVTEAFTEHHKHFLSATSQRRRRTIKSRVTNTQHDHVTMETRQLRFTRTQPYERIDSLQIILTRVHLKANFGISKYTLSFCHFFLELTYLH